MKKLIIAALMNCVLVFAAAGCGNSKTQSSANSQQEQMQIAPKQLTEDERHIMTMLGTQGSYSTGILEFKGNEKVKSVAVKIMEYHEGAKKWSCIYKRKKRVNESGEIIVSYNDDGTQLSCNIADSKDDVNGSTVTGLEKLPQNKGGVEVENETTVGVPLTLDKEIAVHMVVYSKPNKETRESPDMQDYPNIKAFKDYQYVRTIVLNFSDQSLDAD